MTSALLVIDMQNDFLPGGALAVEGGDQIIRPIIEIVPDYDLVVFTQDWHPAGHKSFASSHAERKPFDVVQMYGRDQVLWPDHCVQGTRGAEIHSAFRETAFCVVDPTPLDCAALILRKGMNPEVDSYSAFRENWGPNPGGQGYSRRSTGLQGFLLERMVRKVTIVGLARDYCVKWSAEDIAHVIPTEVLWELTRPVAPANDAQVEHELRRADVKIVK